MKGMKFAVSILAAVVLAGGACKKKEDKKTAAGPAAVKRVFVDSSPQTGNIGSIANADTSCATAAGRGNLGGTWKAWISDSGTDAVSRMADVGPWYLVNKTTKVFDDKAAMLGNPLVAINMTESGNTMSGSFPVWTGTTLAGTKHTDTCSNWTTLSGNGRHGLHDQSDGDWSDAASQSCGSQAHLYCFEQ
jgi:hypothetical protein